MTESTGDTAFVVPLGRIPEDEALQVGMKAFRLGSLLRSGFPVPDGYVIKEEACQDREGLLSSIRNMFGGQIDHQSVAVRSSASNEDSSTRSFAGMYQTLLRVRGAEAVLEAVESCLSSARRVAHSNAYGLAAVGRNAIIVQTMIHAQASGVAFTRNPVTRAEETVINAGAGIGEHTVDGSVTPESWVVSHSGEVRQKSGPGIIDHAIAGAVASLAKQVESYFGEPQDIEWAWLDGKLYLLQARPITRRAHADESGVLEAGWMRDPLHYPYPLCPAFRWDLQHLEKACTIIFEENGILLETIQAREVGGWPYFKELHLQGDHQEQGHSAAYDGFWQRLTKSLRVVRTDKLEQDTLRWRQEWRPRWAGDIARYRGIALESLSDSELEEHLGQMKQFLLDSKVMHLRMNYPFAVAVGEFVLACREWFGWSDQKCLAMLQGTSSTSSDPARELAELAKLAQSRDKVAGLLLHLTPHTLETLKTEDAVFYDALERYRGSYGCRALRYEVMDKTVAELPELLLRLVRNQMLQQAGSQHATGENVLEEARTLLRNESPEERERFERLLERALERYGLREENGYYTVGAPLALMRYALLEAGRRLCSRHQLDEASSVFLLELDEILQGLRFPDADYRTAVVMRERERESALRRGPLPSVPEPVHGGPVEVEIPQEVRRYYDSIHWFVSRDEGDAGNAGPLMEEQASTIAAGVPACAGVYTGTARIVYSEADFVKINEGDILVCTTVPPGWAVLFSTIGALVTDIGGVLSHAAIIAREFNIPSVMATGNGTQAIKDGQRITVHGLTGKVSM